MTKTFGRLTAAEGFITPLPATHQAGDPGTMGTNIEGLAAMKPFLPRHRTPDSGTSAGTGKASALSADQPQLRLGQTDRSGTRRHRACGVTTLRPTASGRKSH